MPAGSNNSAGAMMNTTGRGPDVYVRRMRRPTADPGEPVRLSPPFERASVPLPGSGPLADVQDAAMRASLLANAAAQADYGMSPFSADATAARFDGQRWSWRKRVGAGTGDFEADVRMGSDGTVEAINVNWIIDTLP